MKKKTVSNICSLKTFLQAIICHNDYKTVKIEKHCLISHADETPFFKVLNIQI